MAFITKPEVEKKNVQRVILKAKRREDCRVTLEFPKWEQKNKKTRFITGVPGYLLNFVVVQMHLDNLNAGHE